MARRYQLGITSQGIEGETIRLQHPQILFVTAETTIPQPFLRELQNINCQIESRQAASESDFMACLEPAPDLILIDVTIATASIASGRVTAAKFGVASALQILRQRDLDVPLIVIADAAREREALAALEQGAVDYLLRDRLARLGPAVARALAEKEQRREIRETRSRLDTEENFFRALVEYSRDASILLDASRKIRYFSPALTHILGYQSGEIVGKSIFEFIHPDDHKPLLQMLSELSQSNNGSVTRETRYRHRDGTWRCFEGPGMCMTDACGVKTFVVNLHDISERKQAESALLQERDFISAVVDTLGGLVLVLDRQGSIVRFNRACEQLSGYSLQEVQNRPVFDFLLPPAEAEEARKHFAGTLSGSFPSQRENYLLTKGGEHRLIAWSNTALRDERGDVEYVIGTGIDITEARLAEENLAESEARYRLLAETARDSIFILNAEGRFQYINEYGAHLAGLPVDEVIGKSQEELFPPEVAAVTQRGVDITFTTGEPFYEETWLVLQGRELWASVRLVPLRRGNGEIYAVLGIGRDLTERRRMEERLRHLSQAVEQSPITIIITDLKGDIEYVNARFCELTGYSAEEVIGRNPRLLKSGETSADEYRRLWEQITAGDVWHGELHNRKKNGELYWEAAAMSPIRDANGNITHYLSLKEDITERKQREAELEAIAAMSAALRLASSVQQMFPIILNQMQSLMGSEGGILILRDLENGDGVVQYADGAWGGAMGLRLKEDEGIAGQVMKSGRPFNTDNLQAEPSVIRPDLLGSLPAAGIVPLFTHQQTIGALFIGRNKPFNDSEMRMLGAAGEISANAIHRATLHEQTERRLQQLTALRTIDMAISASLDLRVTLHVVLDEVMTQLNADAVCVFLLHEEDQSLHYAAGRGLNGSQMERSTLRVGQPLAGQAALERQTVRVLDLPVFIKSAPPGTTMPDQEFSVYYGVPLISKGRVQGVLEIYRRASQAPDADWEDFLEALAGQASIAVDNAGLFEDLQRSNVDLTLAYDSTIEGWSRALDLRDNETEGHSLRVTDVTLRLAGAMGLTASELMHIRRGALLHDIGKMGIPDSILLKPDSLTEDEWKVMRQHPVFAYELLYPIPFLRPALDIPYCHHERWDGSGYPRGLKGEQIPLAARIFAVVDVWDALRSDRPYRAGWSADKVRDHIRAASSSHFDPRVVEAFLDLLNAESSAAAEPDSLLAPETV